MRAVNLLPREIHKQRRLNAQNLPAVVGGGVGVLVVAILSGGYLMESSKVASAQRDLDTAKAQLAATPLPPPAPAQTNTTPSAIASEQQPRLQAVSAALSQRIAWDRVLREFSLVLPPDVWVSSLSLTAPSGTTVSSGFTIAGNTYSYDSVARLLSRLALVPDLTNVTLGSTSANGPLVSFNVTAGIKGAVVPVAPAAPVPAPAPATTDTTGATG